MTRGGHLSLLVLLCAAGCQQKMADQPSYRPLVPAHFFVEQTSARSLPHGTLAREWARADDPLGSGLKPEARRELPSKVEGAPNVSTQPTVDAPTDPARFMTRLPFELTRADLERGQERFTIYCTPCHDPIGTGHGKIVERGYVEPPNFHRDESRGFARYGKHVPLREVPLGYVFGVISHGYGAMPSYGPQVEPKDRWRIAAYVRALQLSQHAVLDKLPDETKRAAQAALEVKP